VKFNSYCSYTHKYLPPLVTTRVNLNTLNRFLADKVSREIYMWRPANPDRLPLPVGTLASSGKAQSDSLLVREAVKCPGSLYGPSLTSTSISETETELNSLIHLYTPLYTYTMYANYEW